MSDEKKYGGINAFQWFLSNIKTIFSEKGHTHTIDSAFSSTSTNPVQNKVIDAEFDAISTAMGILEAEIDKKSDAGHNHDTAYDTKGAASSALSEAKEYVDTVASGKASTEHNHDDDYDAIGAANTALASAKGYTDTKVSGLASTSSVNTSISTHNTSTTAHGDIRELITNLTTRLNALANSTDEDLDQMAEIVTYIKANKSLIDSITTSKINVSDIVDNLTTSSTSKVLSAKQGVEIKKLIDTLQTELDEHGHAIADVSGLQTALDGKAASSHGTHVSYSTTAPVMDGTASVGTASTVARSDHKHPTDTSRASQADLDALESTVSTHTSNKSNPHGVTKAQVGLGSVPNVATNDQTPTYTAASTLATLVSGEKLSVSMGKIMKAISDLISHLANKSNPHAVTKAQVGLGNVENKSSATIRGELTSANVTTALGYTPPTTNTTYSVVSTTADGLAPKRDGSTTKFLRADGTWAVPPDTNTDTNTTYTFATGDSNGQIKITPSGGSAQNVSVKGLGTAAYTASTAYATAAQGTLASNAMPKSGGTFTGAVMQDTTAKRQACLRNIRVFSSDGTIQSTGWIDMYRK